MPQASPDDLVRVQKWIRFLRGYGPVPKNENMYDEFIRKTASRFGVQPLDFDHPVRSRVIDAICGAHPRSVVLTGTAGDGKTYLCRQVWEAIGAAEDDSTYVTTSVTSGGILRTLHVIRDLSAWAPPHGSPWGSEREKILHRLAVSVLHPDQSSDLFLVAANDGQLLESWHRLTQTEDVAAVGELVESLLVEETQEREGAALLLLNLSQVHAADVFDLALDAVLAHPEWERCRGLNAGPGLFFGPECPIRHNLELLQTPLVRSRLRALVALCDHNRIHIPVRQVFLLLANALLGHPGARDGLMRAEDVGSIIRDRTVGKASLFANVFGGNLSTARREARVVFEALGRFGIGYETTNRIDNVLIIGDADSAHRPDFARFITDDKFYGADDAFLAAQREYIEGAEEDETRSPTFLDQLIDKRRGLFFKIPPEEAADLHLWQLTVFSRAGEYLERVVQPLENQQPVDRTIMSRLVRGLNRVFTGLLLSDDRELLLASSLTVSEGRVSRLLEERVSVEPRRHGECVRIAMSRSNMPQLEVAFDYAHARTLTLNLTRYEFLSRVADGALPSSFSKECYEDMLAFKSQLLGVLSQLRPDALPGAFSIRVLDVDDNGKAAVSDLEVPCV